MSFDRKDARLLPRWAERSVLIDAAGMRHAPVTLPPDFQRGFAEGVKKGMKQGDDVAVHLIAFKVKLDAATDQPFRLVILDPKRERAATTFRWQPPLPLPEPLAEALSQARRP
jgi:hypothetical protein